MSVERRPAAARVADVGDRRAREIQREAAAIDDDLDDVRVGQLGRVVDAAVQRRHLHRRIGGNGATASSIARGSISGSSPCTLTTMSQSSDAATSASRSVPVACVAFVSRTLPPKSLHARRDAQIVGRDDDLATRPRAPTRGGRRARSSDGRRGRRAALPGSRVEANRAGMTATMVSGGTESTLEPVDAGCTTNNSTTAKVRVLRSRSTSMNLKRTATIVVGGAALAAWLAGAATSNHAIAAGADRRSSRADRAARRRARARDRAAARAAAADGGAARSRAAICSRSARRAAPRRAAVASRRPRRRRQRRLRPPPPPLKLVGIAEDAGAGRSGAHRDHLRRRASCSSSRKARRVTAAVSRRRRSRPTSSSSIATSADGSTRSAPAPSK